MFIRIKTSPNSAKKAVQIVENIRTGDKVRQRIVRHVGNALDDEELVRMKELAEAIKLKLKSQTAPSLFSQEELFEMVISTRRSKTLGDDSMAVDLKKLVEEQRVVIGIHDVYGKIYRDLGFLNVLGDRLKEKEANNRLFHLVMARIAKPESKRASVTLLERDFGIPLLLQSVYEMMDKIKDKQEELICKLAWNAAVSVIGTKVNVLFYDCTTLYFESFTEDELKQFGYSKDNKFNQSQVVLALLATEEGLPVGYQIFPGATFEGNTMETVLKNIETRYQISNVFFVADSAMLSQKNLEMLESGDRKYIVGARLKNLKKSLTEKIVDTSTYKTLPGINSTDENDKLKIASFDLDKSRKLIVTYSPSRAKKDKSDREKSVEQLKSKLEKSSNPLSLISNFGYKKFIISEKPGEIKLDEAKLKKESRWDGLRGMMTNATTLSPEEVITHYHGLWQIEECFRLSKHNLQIRPIYHWTPDRIKGHIAICFIALVCMRHLYNRVAKDYTRLSAEVIRKELTQVQLSILKNTQDGKRYALPSKSTEQAQKIYQILGLKLPEAPFQIKTN